MKKKTPKQIKPKGTLHCIGHSWKVGREHRAVMFGYAEANDGKEGLWVIRFIKGKKNPKITEVAFSLQAYAAIYDLMRRVAGNPENVK